MSSSNISFAQIGLGMDVTGAVLALLLIGFLALVGLAICVVSLIYKKRMFLLLGFVMMAPALYNSFVTLAEEFPRWKSWDFSSTRCVSGPGSR